MEQLTTATLTQLPQVRALGRHAGRDPLTLFWTASGMELEFTGSELWVDFFADYEVVEPWVSVELNGAWVARFAVSPGKSRVCLFRGMTPGKAKHLRLLKDVQAMHDDPAHLLQITGLEYAGGEFLPLPEPKYRLEFVGDSITSGEGAIGAKPEEDYSDNYFESHYGVNKDDVVVYKGDAETYQSGYKLDEGKLPEGETDEGYFFKELTDFFNSHKDLSSQADYDEFSKLVDTDSVRDYFLAEVWINNKWDWPGKNWSMWKVQNTDSSNEYADGKWRFMFYDVEFGGVSGEGDAWTNTMKEDNYKPKGLLDTDTKNPAVLSFAYLMSNENFRNDFNDWLLKMSEGTFEKEKALDRLAEFESIYSPLYEQFFARYPETGSTEEALHGGYASSDCIRAFINKRDKSIQSIVDWTNSQF